MTWRYTKAGKVMDRPDSEVGLYIEGPLTVEDWKVVLQDIVDELAEQARREGMKDVSKAPL
jgi:hypothetical protein